MIYYTFKEREEGTHTGEEAITIAERLLKDRGYRGPVCVNAMPYWLRNEPITMASLNIIVEQIIDDTYAYSFEEYAIS